MFRWFYGKGLNGYKGFGIGLVIVKLVIDWLGGSVRIESEVE